MNPKILIISGSLHQIPPTSNSPAVPRILFTISRNLEKKYDLKIISFRKDDPEQIHDARKYIQIDPDSSIYRFWRMIFSWLPYRIKMKIFGRSEAKFLSYWWCMRPYIKAFKPDIIFTTMHVHVFKFGLWHYPKAKHVFYYRSSDILSQDRKVLQQIAKKATGLISLTRESIAQFNSEFRFSKVKTATIENAVDSDLFNKKRVEQLSSQSRKRFNLTEDDWVLGFAGRLSLSKGIDKILKVMIELLPLYPNLKLLIAGDQKFNSIRDDDEMTVINDLIKGLPNDSVIFTGWLQYKEMIAFYASLDIALLLSQKKEGNSMFGMESMACGKPLVATTVGGNPEIIINNKTGILIDVTDIVGGLKNAVSVLYQNQGLYNEISTNASEHIIKNYSIEKLNNSIDIFFDELFHG